MRILLLTGKGGVGKSTLAAATAVHSARAGKRTLVISTDAAHSLADALGVEAGHEPREIEPNLSVAHVDGQRRFEESWREFQHYLLSVMEAAGVEPLVAEELTVLPGAEEVLALMELRQHARSGAWDVIVVDCAPTAETIRLLALPEALNWYMARIFPTQRRMVRTLGPLLSRAAGVPMPEDGVFVAIQRLHDHLREVGELLSGADASVRIVLTPEAVVIAEARRLQALLALYGYRVDAVIANRIFPQNSDDPWIAGWAAAQHRMLEEVADSFAGVTVWRSPYLAREPIGTEALAQVAAELFGPDDPVAPVEGHNPVRVERTATETVLTVALPGVAKGEVAVARTGADLVLTVGSYRRLITLPTTLGRMSVIGANLDPTTDRGVLRVRFRAHPDSSAEERR